MTRQSPMFRIAAGSAVALAMLMTASDARGQYAVFDADAALTAFHDRVEAYAALHRRLAPPPAAMTSTDSISRLLTRHYLAAAVAGARRSAQQGEIFTPEVATLFRWMLADAVGELDGERFVLQLNGGASLQRGIHPDINEPFLMLPLYRVPADVRVALPPIPAELDYRIAGYDLVLWDIYAGIVVDYVPDALTSPVATN